jgi:transcriptional regulator GlxA family with amidase domain
MVIPGAAVAAMLRWGALRAIPRELGVVVRRLEGAAPRAAPALAWLAAHRRAGAAALSLVAGVLLVAAGGGLL